MVSGGTGGDEMAAFSGSMVSRSTGIVGVLVPYFDGHPLVTTLSPNGIYIKKQPQKSGKKKEEG